MYHTSSFCIQELQSFESPQLMTLIDDSHGDNQICVGYKNQFDLINEKNGDTLQLYQFEASKVSATIIVATATTTTTTAATAATTTAAAAAAVVNTTTNKRLLQQNYRPNYTMCLLHI